MRPRVVELFYLAVLNFQLIELHRAAIDPRRSTGLEPCDSQSGPYQLFGEVATSGEDALDLTRARDFNVVFSDVVMPGMGGLRLAERLAEEKPDLPVILATGYSQEIAQSGSGGRPVILKPYRLATLSEALTDAIGKTNQPR